MRILESCTSFWPSPHLIKQVDMAHEALSVDVSKPFELKPSLRNFQANNPETSVDVIYDWLDLETFPAEDLMSWASFEFTRI